MTKRLLISILFLLAASTSFGQNPKKDSLLVNDTSLFLIDTTIDYDLLFRDFEAFMDSLLSPRSYLMGTVAVSRGIYNFEGKNDFTVDAVKKYTYSPLLGYFHKSGFGITGTGYIIHDEKNLNLFQTSITPSFDFIQDKRFIAGFSYSRYITKKDLPFYTTPLLNELYGYFTYRKTWLRPSLSVNYGWGSRSDYDQRESLIQDLRLRRNGVTYINTEESIKDFSVMASLRHDFYWIDLFGKRDHLRFTPQVSFTSGTQQFGFNQKANTYATVIRTGNNILFNTENVYLDDKVNFQPLSMTLFMRGEYFFGNFFIQPQYILDYYFPARNNNFSHFFSFNTGFVF